MLTVLVDPGLFAVPPYAPDEDDVYELILRVQHWSSMSDGGAPVRLLKIAGSDEVLYDANSWPLEGNLQALLELYNLTHVFTPRDVFRVYTNLFARLESWADWHAEVVECSAIDLEPDILAQHEPPAIVGLSRMVYTNQALHDALNVGKFAFVASGLPHKGPTSTVVGGQIIRVEGLDSSNVPLPFVLSQRVRLLDRLEDVESFYFAQSHWDSSETIEDLFAAISFGCLALERVRGKQAKLEDLPRFSIGSDFFSTLPQIQAAPGQPRGKLLLECCCRIVLGQPKNELKPMGKPDQIIRSRDRATAWRTHVTKGHEGSRLMLWRSNDIYEFANVAVKHDVYIAKGDPAKRYRHDW